MLLPPPPCPLSSILTVSLSASHPLTPHHLTYMLIVSELLLFGNPLLLLNSILVLVYLFFF